MFNLLHSLEIFIIFTLFAFYVDFNFIFYDLLNLSTLCNILAALTQEFSNYTLYHLILFYYIQLSTIYVYIIPCVFHSLCIYTPVSV